MEWRRFVTYLSNDPRIIYCYYVFAVGVRQIILATVKGKLCGSTLNFPTLNFRFAVMRQLILGEVADLIPYSSSFSL